jgi:hypothetical protein
MLTVVKWYGLVETVGGALKCCLILGASILLYTIAGKGICFISAQFLEPL